MLGRFTKLVIGIVGIFLFGASIMLAEGGPAFKGKGTFLVSNDPADLGLVTLTGRGNATSLGQWTCYGELFFEEGDALGVIEGHGILIFEAANGDLLVGLATWAIGTDDPGLGSAHWVDTAVLSDGTVVHTTGRFVDRRPPGAGFRTNLTVNEPKRFNVEMYVEYGSSSSDCKGESPMHCPLCQRPIKGRPCSLEGKRVCKDCYQMQTRLLNVQRSFGAHDISGVPAHTSVSSAADKTLGAEGFTQTDAVGFKGVRASQRVSHELAHPVAKTQQQLFGR